MRHKGDGYEFSAIGASRIFRKGDFVEDSFEGQDIVHRRYLMGDKTWFDKDYEPTVAQQTKEHLNIFAYDVMKSYYTMINPDAAVMESSGDVSVDLDIDMPPVPKPISLQDEVENVIKDIDEIFDESNEVLAEETETPIQPKSRGRK